MPLLPVASGPLASLPAASRRPLTAPFSRIQSRLTALESPIRVTPSARAEIKRLRATGDGLQPERRSRAIAVCLVPAPRLRSSMMVGLARALTSYQLTNSTGPASIKKLWLRATGDWLQQEIGMCRSTLAVARSLLPVACLPVACCPTLSAIAKGTTVPPVRPVPSWKIWRSSSDRCPWKQRASPSASPAALRSSFP
jgi:hypothetical protein